MANGIVYDKTLNDAAGYLTIGSDSTQPMRPQDRKTLVHLLFYALYTREGRGVMRDNKPANGNLGTTERTNLVNKFAEFNVTDSVLVEAILDAHVAADNYANAFKSPPGTQGKEKAMADNEKIYQQKMSFICWQLWEDAKDHEFSLGW